MSGRALMRYITKICAVLLYMVFSATIAQENGSKEGRMHVRLELDGVVNASAKADGRKISELIERYKNSKYASVYASALAYSTFDFAKSEVAARKCFNNKDDGSPLYANVHLICGQFISRIYFIHGDYKKWAKFNLFLKGGGVSTLRERYPQIGGSPIESLELDFSKFVDWPTGGISPVSRSRHSTPVSWKMISSDLRFTPDGTIPYVGIAINGVMVDAALDTESSLLIIPDSLAKKFKLKYVTDYGRGLKTGNGENLAAKVVMIKTLVIAGVRLNNTIAVVSKTRTQPLIGLLDIIRLRKVVIGRHRMTILNQSGTSLSCSQRMYLGSLLSGFPYLIRMGSVINGHPERPVMDTGYATVFRKTVATMDKSKQQSFTAYDAAGPVQTFGYMESAMIGAGRAGQAVRGQVMLDKNDPDGYNFGAQMIRALGPLYLDFDSGHACFLKDQAAAEFDSPSSAKLD